MKREPERKKKSKMSSCLRFSLSSCLGTFGSAPWPACRSAFSSLVLFVKEHLLDLFLLISLTFCFSSSMANTQNR